MKLISNMIRMQYNEAQKPEIILTTSGNIRKEVEELKAIVASGKPLAVEIKQHRKRRSLDANSYLWVLCQKIAEVIRATKEDVYRKAIREVGQFEIVPIKAAAVDRWIEVWNSKGFGWFAEDMEESKLPGYKKVISYYGSSVYDTREMAVLIDNIVQECKELGIETMPPAELAALKDNWGAQINKSKM
jgi:hypothetical protein